MKNNLRSLLTVTGSLLLTLTQGLAQGTLTPPGAPAPTMKTLTDIEPRTAISALPFTIINGGSYYLTTNLTGASGLIISTNNVTLDLNGFALLGGTGDGVHVNGACTNVAIRNGTISGWSNMGINAYSGSSPSGASRNFVIEGLIVSGNGSYGIYVPVGSVVRNCISQGNHSDGIESYGSLIERCQVRDNLGQGIQCYVTDVRDCQIQANTKNGIILNSGSVTGCYVQGNTFSGIYMDFPGCQIVGNTCIGNNTTNDAFSAGIFMDSNNNRIDSNQVTASGFSGIHVDSGYVNNVIIRNTVAGNGASNYLGTASNDFGPVGTAAAATSPWANISH